MSNHSKDDIDAANKAGDILKTAGLIAAIGGIGALGKSMIDKNNNEKARNEIIINNEKVRNEMVRIKNRIDSLRGEFLGSILNADEIERLEKELAACEKKLK